MKKIVAIGLCVLGMCCAPLYAQNEIRIAQGCVFTVRGPVEW